MLRRLINSEYFILGLCAAYFLALAPVTPGFASWGNAQNIFSAMLPLLVVAIGQTLVLITAGIDLSVTSIIALASVTGALLINSESGALAGSYLAPAAGMLVMIVTGGGIGLLNGTIITRFGMPPFIVTLTTMMFFSGFAVWMTESEAIYNLPSSFVLAGKNIWVAGAVSLLLTVIAHLLLTRTLFGRWLYAIGHNSKAALISGVPVDRVLIVAYILSGLCAGVAAILITGRLETGSPVHWRNNLLDIIGAAVIGGTSLFGGRGKIAWTLAGVLLLTLIDNSLNLLNLSHFAIMMVKGAVIAAAATLDSLRTRWSAARP